ILRAATVDRTTFGCLQAGFRNPARSRQAARRSGAARDVEAVGAVAAGVILLALHLTEGPEAVEAVVFSRVADERRLKQEARLVLFDREAVLRVVGRGVVLELVTRKRSVDFEAEPHPVRGRVLNRVFAVVVAAAGPFQGS